MKEIEILSAGEPISATIFQGADNGTVLVIASATGVKQGYYQKFAQFLAETGITVITFDYKGIGRSLKKPLVSYKNNAADWGSKDLEGVLQYVITNYPTSRKIALGHSIGGQLIGLAKSSVQLDKIILVAAQSGYWGHWKGFGKLKMWLNWYVLFPIILGCFGYLRSKEISGMENLPKRVANQWATWGKNKRYILGDPTLGTTYYKTIEVPITAFSIADDSFAPIKAVQWLTNAYSNTKRKSVHLDPKAFKANKIGHFGVFKERFKNTIWTLIKSELE